MQLTQSVSTSIATCCAPHTATTARGDLSSVSAQIAGGVDADELRARVDAVKNTTECEIRLLAYEFALTQVHDDDTRPHEAHVRIAWWTGAGHASIGAILLHLYISVLPSPYMLLCLDFGTHAKPISALLGVHKSGGCYTITVVDGTEPPCTLDAACLPNRRC